MLQYVEDQYELEYNDYYIYYSNCYCLYNGEYHYVQYINDNDIDENTATIRHCKSGATYSIYISDLDFDITLQQGLILYKDKVYYVYKAIGESPYKYRKGACPHNYLIYSNGVTSTYHEIVKCPSMVKPLPQVTVETALLVLSEETPNIALSDDVHLNLTNNIIRVYHKLIRVGRYYKTKNKFKVSPYFKLYATVLNMKVEE